MFEWLTDKHDVPIVSKWPVVGGYFKDYSVLDSVIDVGLGLITIPLAATGVGSVGAAGLWAARAARVVPKVNKAIKAFKTPQVKGALKNRFKALNKSLKDPNSTVSEKLKDIEFSRLSKSQKREMQKDLLRSSGKRGKITKADRDAIFMDSRMPSTMKAQIKSNLDIQDKEFSRVLGFGKRKLKRNDRIGRAVDSRFPGKEIVKGTLAVGATGLIVKNKLEGDLSQDGLVTDLNERASKNYAAGNTAWWGGQSALAYLFKANNRPPPQVHGQAPLPSGNQPVTQGGNTGQPAGQPLAPAAAGMIDAGMLGDMFNGMMDGVDDHLSELFNRAGFSNAYKKMKDFGSTVSDFFTEGGFAKLSAQYPNLGSYAAMAGAAFGAMFLFGDFSITGMLKNVLKIAVAGYALLHVAKLFRDYSSNTNNALNMQSSSGNNNTNNINNNVTNITGTPPQAPGTSFTPTPVLNP